MKSPIEIIAYNNSGKDVYLNVMPETPFPFHAVDIILSPLKAELEKILVEPLVIRKTIIESSISVVKLDVASGGKGIVFYNMKRSETVKIRLDTTQTTRFMAYDDTRHIIHGHIFARIFLASNSRLKISLFDDECLELAKPLMAKLYGRQKDNYGDTLLD